MDIACNPTAHAGNGHGLSEDGAHGTQQQIHDAKLTSDGKRKRNEYVTKYSGASMGSKPECQQQLALPLLS